MISRIFPKTLTLTPLFIYALGILVGEGATALGKSNYRRFTVTNSDYRIIKVVLDQLEQNDLFQKRDLIDKSLHLLHFTKSNDEVIRYWSKSLGLPKSRFKCFDMERKTKPYGVCHVYISDVLLRRVIDLIHEFIFKKSLA